jgi:hypothetical protein
VVIGVLVGAGVASAAPLLNSPEDCQLVEGALIPGADPVEAAAGTPLEGRDPDCAVDVDGNDSAGEAVERQRILIYRAGYEVFQEIVEQFLASGWAFQGGAISDGDGESDEVDSAGDFPVAAPFNTYANFVEAGSGFSVTLEFTAAADEGISWSHHVPLGDDEEFAYSNRTGPIVSASVYRYRVASTGAGIAEPSILSTLKTVGEALPNPTQAAVIGGASLMLMLVVGYPGYLLSSVVASLYERWVEPRWTTLRARLERGRVRRLLVLGGGVVAASIIAGFVDPGFGFNAWSFRLVLTALLAFLVFNLGGAAVVRAVMRRIEPGVETELRFRWGSLLVLLAAVIVCRLLSFAPGVIFGLVAGLAFATTLAASRRAVVVLVGSGFAAAAGLVAWVGYSLVAPLADAAPGSLGPVFGAELLSALTIEGIATLPLALLPFAGLEGADLRRWRRGAWIAAYAVAVALFLLVLATIPASWGEVSGDLVRWIIVFAVFSAVAIGIWAGYQRFVATRSPTR